MERRTDRVQNRKASVACGRTFYKKVFWIILGFIFVFMLANAIFNDAIAQSQSKPNAANQLPHSYKHAVQIAAPSVVNIFTYKVRRTPTAPGGGDNFRRRMQGHYFPVVRRKATLGSGVIMDSKGYILTNNHVIRNAQSILVALTDGRKTKAKVIGTDPETDLALLHITLKDLKPIPFGDSESIHVGDVVLAIGNPFGLGQTVTQGIISAIGRTRVGINPLENYIQTDAAINPGNSGGALINTMGRLIGINTGIYSKSGGYQGVGFAIPVSAALNVMHQIIKYGKVKRGWLGAKVATLTPLIAKTLKSKLSSGVVIIQVLPNTPAAKAGLKPKDIIVLLNNHRVTSGLGLMSYIAQKTPGDAITITLMRNNDKKIVKVKLGTRPAPAARDRRHLDRWGDEPEPNGSLPGAR